MVPAVDFCRMCSVHGDARCVYSPAGIVAAMQWLARSRFHDVEELVEADAGAAAGIEYPSAFGHGGIENHGAESDQVVDVDIVAADRSITPYMECLVAQNFAKGG